jgi:hypothetical protein
MNLVTDLIDQLIMVPHPSPNDLNGFVFGKVRAVYVAENRLRLAVLLTSGYIVDIEAHSAKIKRGPL